MKNTLLTILPLLLLDPSHSQSNLRSRKSSPSSETATQPQVIETEPQHLRISTARGIIGLSIPDDASGNTVNYGNRHPHELGYNDKEDEDPYQPIRISFQGGGFHTNDRIAIVEREVLPEVEKLWSSALSVVPVQDRLFPYTSYCGEVDVPMDHLTNGISETDLIVYLSESEFCSNTGAYSAVCNFDQHMRPIVGNIAICMDEIKFSEQQQPQTLAPSEKQRLINLLSHQLGQILGLSPNLFQHYRDPETGIHYGTTPQKSVTCIDGTQTTMDLPNIVQRGIDQRGNNYFQITSPTVLQTARNHFDCQMLSGARLDNRHDGTTCFGSHWDERFYFNENMTPLKPTTYPSITPLTLALLQDSSWYKTNTIISSIPSFGHGAGCAFLEGDCLLRDGSIPSYSRGFFCNSNQEYGCDATHQYKAACDVGIQITDDNDGSSSSSNNNDSQSQFNFGSPYRDTNYCPIKSRNLISCTSSKRSPSQIGEVFGEQSKCFETSKQNSICLEAYCNVSSKRVEFVFEQKVHECSYAGETIDTTQGFEIECPSVASICPELICPANCSGRGMCDYSLEFPVCICDDPFDTTPGCWESI